MDKGKILRDMDELAVAKKNGSLCMKLIIGFAGLCVLGMMIWSFMVIASAMGKILVVDRSGEYLKVMVEDNERLNLSLINNHCYQTAYYTNSFDRLSINENHARAEFLANSDDLNRIFAMYHGQRAYGDALDRGVIYRCDFEKVTELKENAGEYHITFTSILTIVNGNTNKYIRITSKGIAIRCTPRYPENVSGFFFKSYVQEYENLKVE